MLAWQRKIYVNLLFVKVLWTHFPLTALSAVYLCRRPAMTPAANKSRRNLLPKVAAEKPQQVFSRENQYCFWLVDSVAQAHQQVLGLLVFLLFINCFFDFFVCFFPRCKEKSNRISLCSSDCMKLTIQDRLVLNSQSSRLHLPVLERKAQATMWGFLPFYKDQCLQLQTYSEVWKTNKDRGVFYEPGVVGHTFNSSTGEVEAGAGGSL